jgi:molybdopterin-guanine dinucleotide biosynthesis protein A
LNTITSKNTVQGLILAGGQSRRLGGVDKGLLELKGEPLVNHVARTLRLQTSAISIAANRSLSAYEKYAPEVLPDTIDGFAGPLAGLATFAGRAHSNWVAIVACDLIFLPEDWVARLLNAAHNRKAVCAVDATTGKSALCALVQRECLTSAATLLDHGQHRWMDWLSYNEAGTALFDREALFNINSWDDVKKAEILLSNNKLRY